MATEAYPLGYVAGRHATENAAGGVFQQPQLPNRWEARNVPAADSATAP
jgi:hypothetical protein